jgi:hypothetical protein
VASEEVDRDVPPARVVKGGDGVSQATISHIGYIVDLARLGAVGRKREARNTRRRSKRFQCSLRSLSLAMADLILVRSMTPVVLNRIGLLADALLFFSGLLLLIDLSPRDFMPRFARQKAALARLREHHNLVLPAPPGVNFKPETQTMKMAEDPAAVHTLADLIRERSSLAHTVPWAQMAGVGFSTMSAPVGQLKVDAFHPLYVAVVPRGDAASLELIPVGQLEDLDRWITSWHQSSLTMTAATFLTLGFLLQLVVRFCTR